MIEHIPVGYDVEFRCETCDVTDNFYTSDKFIFEAYKEEHNLHNANLNIETRFVLSNPDYVLPYPCNGCELCEDV